MAESFLTIPAVAQRRRVPAKAAVRVCSRPTRWGTPAVPNESPRASAAHPKTLRLRLTIRTVLVSALWTVFQPGVSSAEAQSGLETEPAATFATRIRPILVRSCWNCHGAATQTSDLDLRTRESALRGGRLGPAIVPGRAEESRFYRFVAGLDEPAMPMEGDLLDSTEIAAVRDWINQGAHWDSGSVTTAADALAALQSTDLAPDAWSCASFC